MSPSEPRVAGPVVLYRLFDAGTRSISNAPSIAIVVLIVFEIVLALVQRGA